VQTNNYDRHQKVSRLQARQKLSNCALLVAYIHGQPGGWYGIASGHVDGFANDYAYVHSNPGDIQVHPIRAFFIEGTENADELAELDQICAAVAEYHDSDRPLIATFTGEEKEAALVAVRQALAQEKPEDTEAWLRDLCGSFSELSFCDWDAVVKGL
jgi:hypothetical protein